MKIIEFNSKKGFYQFELNNVNTLFHAHPVVEIVLSEEGLLCVETKNQKLEGLCFAIIGANVPHKISAHQGNVQLTMIECSHDFLQIQLNEFGFQLENGVFAEQTISKHSDLIQYFHTLHRSDQIQKTNNPRVNACFKYLDSEGADYNKMMQSLKSVVHLSESRISHIFKAEVGISLKKYLVWSRLKKAFQLVVDQNANLFEAAIQSGFYDQAHLNKAFKQLLGLSPSEAYNSRTLQD